MRKATAAAAMLLAAGCSGTLGNWAHPHRPACEARHLQDAIGRPASSMLARKMAWTSHAAIVRYLRPGMASTRDVRPDRLNVTLDRQDRITAISCG